MKFENENGNVKIMIAVIVLLVLVILGIVIFKVASKDRTVAVNKVCKTVKGGRKLRFSSLIVAGDKKGRVGMGTGKAKVLMSKEGE